MECQVENCCSLKMLLETSEQTHQRQPPEEHLEYHRECEVRSYGYCTLSPYRLYVNNRLFHGTDRLFFVERALGVDAHPERLMSPQSTGSATLTFFFDYSSPWSFVGFERLEQLLRDVSPVNVKIEWVPFLLGALFKQIGTPNVGIRL